MFQKLKKIHKYIVGKIQALIVMIILPLTYFLGIGIPASLRILFRKKQKPGWKQAEQDVSLETLKWQS